MFYVVFVVVWYFSYYGDHNNVELKLLTASCKNEYMKGLMLERGITDFEVSIIYKCIERA